MKKFFQKSSLLTACKASSPYADSQKGILPSSKAILSFALPIVLAQSTVIICGITDLYFIRWFGADTIAAVALANVVVATLLNFLEGLRIGSAVLVAGHQSKPRPLPTLGPLLLLATVIGFCIAGQSNRITDLVYQLAGSPLWKSLGHDYLAIWLKCFPLILVYYVLTGFYRGLGNTGIPLQSSFLIAGINALFDFLLTGQLAGTPALGAAGTAWSTFLSYVIGILFLLFRLQKFFLQAALNQCRPFELPAYSQALKHMFSFLAEISLYSGFTNLAVFIFVNFFRALGSSALATHQLAFQAFLLSYLPGVGFLVTASVFTVSLSPKDSWQLAKKISIISFSLNASWGILLFFTAPMLAVFFFPLSPQLASDAVFPIRLVAFAQMWTALYMVFRGMLTGQKDTRFILWCGLATGYLLFLPLAYTMIFFWKGGVSGGYLAFCFWTASDCFILFRRLHHKTHSS